jgi:hypothetical protein
MSPILALGAATLALLALAPDALRLGFPALALVTAAVLFRRDRALYLQFCLWLWLTTFEVRRLVDWRTAFNDSAPILLAPYLATSVSGVLLLKHLRALARPAAVPMACALAGTLFGTLYGFTRYAPADVLRGVVNWLAPILFAFFLYQERDRYQQYREAFTGAFIWGTLLTSVYGILQFFLLPPWDEVWMRGIDNPAFGPPVPLKLRIFSTMNGPPGFATYMMAGLLLIFCIPAENRRQAGRTRLKIVASVAAATGLLALALTASRSLWLGLIFGVLYLGWSMPGRARLKIAGTVLITLVVGAAASQLPGIHEIVSVRLKSFASGTSDVSASARIAGHGEALARLATEPLGEGMGSTDVDHKTNGYDDSLGPHDSTLLELLYALGGPGTLVYATGLGWGLLMIFLPRFARSTQERQPFAFAMRAIGFALFAQSLLTSILIGVPGFMTWTCLAFSLAASNSAKKVQVEKLEPQELFSRA